jgi:hypothetical protein
MQKRMLNLNVCGEENVQRRTERGRRQGKCAAHNRALLWSAMMGNSPSSDRRRHRGVRERGAMERDATPGSDRRAQRASGMRAESVSRRTLAKILTNEEPPIKTGPVP